MKVAKTSTAASIIGCSNDLLSEILIHLPPKTLKRFKLVSKQWNFLISSDHEFAVSHSRNNSGPTTPAGLFLYHPSRDTDTFSVRFLGNPAGTVPPLSPFLDQLLPRDFAHSYRVFQSCNGLLLCLFFKDDLYRVNAKSLCVIINPTTRGFRILPTPPDLGTNEWFDGLTLVFDPSESHHYKIVSIKRSSQIILGRSELYIYSSETNLWKFHRSINPIEPHLQFPRGVFSNGAVFWIGWKHTYYYNVKSENVGVLDVPVPLPVQSVGYIYTNNYFAESCGRVFYAIAVSVSRPTYFIFELDSVGMKWSDGREEYLNWSKPFRDDTMLHRTSVMAVSRNREDDKWNFVFSLTTPFINRLIINNSVMGRRAQKLFDVHDVSNIYKLQSCDYLPSLVPV